MPRIRRKRIPGALMAHLKRIRERQISTSQLGLLARWLDSDPEVPEGRWLKRMGACPAQRAASRRGGTQAADL